MAISKIRTVTQLIDQVVRENRPGEYLLYGFAIACVAGGMFALVWGVVHGQNVSTICGAVTNVFFWPAMSRASQTRRESVAIRLLEAPLGQAATAEEAARMLSEFFQDDGWPCGYTQAVPRCRASAELESGGRTMRLFKPRHTFHSTVEQLVSGLRDGSVVLSNESAEPMTVPSRPPAGGPNRVPRQPKPLPSTPVAR